MKNQKKERIDYKIVLTTGLIIYLAWIIYPTIYIFFQLSRFLPYLIYQFLPALFPFIAGIALVVIFKKKMALNAALAGLLVLIIHLFVMSQHYPIIDVRRPGDLIWLVTLIIKLPIAAYVGAIVGKFVNTYLNKTKK